MTNHVKLEIITSIPSGVNFPVVLKQNLTKRNHVKCDLPVHVLRGNFVFDLRHVFQERNLGI